MTQQLKLSDFLPTVYLQSNEKVQWYYESLCVYAKAGRSF